MAPGFKKIWGVLTKRERGVFIAASALVILSAALLAGLTINRATKVVPASGGDFTEGFVGQPTYVNPVLASNETDLSAVRLTFSSLSSLADKIEPSADGRTWKIRLKQGLLWADGEKLTSDDVIFTIESIENPDAQSPQAPSWQGVVASRLSELELQFILSNPYAFFNDNLKNLYIVPKHLFADVPPANWKLSEYNLKPVGSGPYIFDSYEKRPDGFITLYHFKINPHYSGTPPYIPGMSFAFFSGLDDLIKNFNTGQIDGVANLGPQDLAQIKRPYELLPFSMPSYYAIFMNQTKNLALKDGGVREALSLSIDRGALVTSVLGGHGHSDFGPIPPGAPYSDQDLAMPTSTADSLNALLDNAGWKRVATTTILNGDASSTVSSTSIDAGFRAKTIGKEIIPLQVTLTVPQIDFLVSTANFVRAAWESLGIKTIINTEPPQTIASGAIKNRDYELLLFGNILSQSSDLYSFWHSSQRFDPGLNLSIFNDKNADSLIESIRQNPDANSRQKQSSNLQKLIASQYPAIFLYSPDFLYATVKNLQGATGAFIADPADRFADAANWYLKTTRAFK